MKRSQESEEDERREDADMKFPVLPHAYLLDTANMRGDNMKQITRCTRCIMDNRSDDTITFDAEGYCNYCTEALEWGKTVYFPGEQGKEKLDALLKKVKEEGRGKPFDCIMGLSGGLDSSYLAYLGYQWGLRILAVHIDDGFDTEVSKRNLEKLVKKTGFKYVVITPDAEQFAELTKAYMKAGVPNIAAPQDNVLFAEIYQYMRKYRIKYFLSGANYALESILQKGNSISAYDLVNLKDIFRKCGKGSIDKLPLISTTQRYIDKLILGIESPRPLDYIDYNRDRAFAELKEFCDFEYYGRKHLENALTAFIQLVWFPQKFGVDKRTSHLSSMIISGQMSREEALTQMEEPLYDAALMDDYITWIKRKFRISDEEFEELMNSQPHQHTDYRSETVWLEPVKKVYHLIKKLAKRSFRQK